MVLGYAQNSIYNLPHHVREFLYFLENQAVWHIKDIRTSHVEAFFRELKRRKHQRRKQSSAPKLSAAYLNKYLQALKLLSKYIRQTRQGHFTVNIHNQKAGRPLPSVLSQAEVTQLYQACGTDALGLRDRLMLSLLYGCGLRRQEAVSLDVQDVLFASRLLYVRKGKNYRERYVPFNASISADLRHYLQAGRPVLQTMQTTQTKHVKALLLNSQGQRLLGQSLLHRLRLLQQKTGIQKKLCLHTLRHSIATHLLVD